MRIISRQELTILSAFFFVLPLFEAIKNLLLLAYLIAWCTQSYKARDFGGRLRSWEWALLLFLLGGFISSYTNPFGWEKPLSGTLTFAKLILPAMLLSRTVITTKKVTFLSASILLGTFIATLASWYVWRRNGGVYPELNSVGHVNQSALYIALAFGVSLALFMMQKGWKRLVATIAVLFFAIALIPTLSTTAVTVIVAMVVAATCMTFRFNRKYLALLAAFLIVIVGSLLVASHYIPTVKSFKSEIEHRIHGGDTGNLFLSKRDVIFHTAVFVLSDFPLFGAGDRHFEVATSKEYVQSVATKRGLPYEPSRFFHTNHGHNLVTSVMVNRGYIGLFLLTGFILIALWQHVRWLSHFYSDRKLELEPLLGIMTGIYIVVGGFGNSTLYVEHGQLAFCLAGLSLGYLQKRRKERSLPVTPQ